MSIYIEIITEMTGKAEKGIISGLGAAAGTIESISKQYNKPVILDNIHVMGGDSQPSQIRDILTAALSNNSNSLTGFSFFEYAPWTQASWIQNPQNDTAKQWLNNIKQDSEFIKNENAEKALLNWMNYSTTDVMGTKKNDTLNVYAGDKKIDGGAGMDTVVIHAKAKDVSMHNLGSGHFSIDSVYTGHFDMFNVEYLKFDDINKVSLLGHQDYTKYNWGTW